MITEREYLERLLGLVGPGAVWDTVFCRLRNATNPKYGGDPAWQGERHPIDHHALSFDWPRYVYEPKIKCLETLIDAVSRLQTRVEGSDLTGEHFVIIDGRLEDLLEDLHMELS